MTEKDKKMWNEAMDGINEEYTDEAAEKVEEQLNKEINDSEFVMVENKKKTKLPVFAVAAAIVTVIGISVFVGIIAATNNMFGTTDSSNIENSSDYSETKTENTLEERFRGLNQELRYKDVINKLGIPYQTGGEHVKCLTYKLDNDRLAVIQFLYGENPRIDYTYISSTLANKTDDDAEYVLHRRACEHDNGYCTHDFYYCDTVGEYEKLCEGLNHEMNLDDVNGVFGAPKSDGQGAVSAITVYYPDNYYAIYAIFSYRASTVDGTYDYRLDCVYMTNRLAGEGEYLFHSSRCKHDEGYCDHEIEEEYTRIDTAQNHYEIKLKELQLSETNTKQDVLDYVGDPDKIEELNVSDSHEFDHLNEDITRYIYTLDDERTGYICFYNNIGTSPILDCSYIYDKTKNEITDFHEISMSCISKTYYDLHK